MPNSTTIAATVFIIFYVPGFAVEIGFRVLLFLLKCLSTLITHLVFIVKFLFKKIYVVLSCAIWLLILFFN